MRVTRSYGKRSHDRKFSANRFQPLSSDSDSESEEPIPHSCADVTHLEQDSETHNLPSIETPELPRGKGSDKKTNNSRPRLSSASTLLQGILLPVRKVRNRVAKQMGKAKSQKKQKTLKTTTAEPPSPTGVRTRSSAPIGQPILPDDPDLTESFSEMDIDLEMDQSEPLADSNSLESSDLLAEPLTRLELEAATAEAITDMLDSVDVGPEPVKRLNVQGIPLDPAHPRFFGVPRYDSLWCSNFRQFEESAVSIDRTLERAIESNPKTDPEKVKLQLEAEPNLKPKLQFLQPLMFAVLIYLFAVRIQQLKHLSRAEEENSEFGSLSDDDKRALFAQDETYNFNRSVLDIYFGTCFTALVAFRLAALRRFTVSKQAWFCQNIGVTTIRVQALSIAGNAPSYINIPPSFTDFSMTSDISQLPNIPSMLHEPENTVDKIIQKIIPNEKIFSSAIGENQGVAVVFPSSHLDLGAAFGPLENLVVIIDEEVARGMNEQALITERFSETAFGAEFIRKTARL